MSIRTVARDFLRKNTALDGLFRRLVWSRISFPEVEMRIMNRLPRNSMDIAVDVGAAMGNYAWILSRKARNVYAFEPGRHHGDFLAARLGGSRINLTRAAVGDTRTTVSMYTAGSGPHALHTATLSEKNPIVSQADVAVETVPQITLDDFFAGRVGDGRSIDLIKIDVEGYENAALRGAEAILRHHHPVVLCEIEARHNPDYGQAFAFLRSLGYKCFLFQHGAFQPFDGDTIEHLQAAEMLEERLQAGSDAKAGGYLNNFLFQHPQSQLQLAGRTLS